MSVKGKNILFYDFGLQTELALRMARDGANVYYFVPWQDAFPRSDKAYIGDGLGMNRVKFFFDVLDDADLVVFPDTYSGDLANYCRKKGYRVFGPGKAEILENDRWKMRLLQKRIGLPTQKTWHIIGIENLINFLKTHKNVWVKINSFRGDIESFYHNEYDSTQAQFLGELLLNAGAKARQMEFVVEEEMKSLEPGYDGWVVNGEYPKISLWGFEQKGTGYVGKVDRYSNLPLPMRLINDKLKPIFKKLGGCSFFSTELIIPEKNKKGYLIDPTVRTPMPVPSAVQIEIFRNISDFIWNAADGKIIDLQPIAKYGVGICIESEWADKHYTEIQFPEKYRQWIKLRRACKIDGKYYALPGFVSIASVIGLGNTIQEAIDRVATIVKEVKAKEMNYSLSGLQEIADNTVKKCKEAGIDF